MSLAAWVDGYVKAWISGAPEEIADLFTEDAVYDPQTSDAPWVGRNTIVENWQDIGDEPGSWTFDWEPVIESPGLSVIRGRTEYAAENRDFRRSVKDALLVVLTSPQFLFLIENSAGPQPERLPNGEVGPGEGGHAAPWCARHSRTTTRSSKGCFSVPIT